MLFSHVTLMRQTRALSGIRTATENSILSFASFFHLQAQLQEIEQNNLWKIISL